MRILVIEDEKKIALALKKGLEQESYAVDVAFDGQDGLGQAMTVDYDLIILDRMLPETDGIQICRALRDHKKTVPILMLTAKDAVRDRAEGLDAGADDYLTKPFAFEELLARVRALLRRPANLEEPVLTAGGLRLDRKTFEVRRNGKLIELSRKEFALLEYLLKNAGRIVTKDMITNHVWDYDADILPNTVEVYIGYLRKKIDRPFTGKPALIQTIRGFGYRLGESGKFSSISEESPIPSGPPSEEIPNLSREKSHV